MRRNLVLGLSCHVWVRLRWTGKCTVALELEDEIHKNVSNPEDVYLLL